MMYSTNHNINRYQITLTVLSSLYIGSGKSYDRFSYIQRGDQCYVLNDVAWTQILCQHGLFEQYLQVVQQKGRSLNLYEDVVRAWQLDFTQIQKHAVSRIIPIDHEVGAFKLHEIHQFMKTPQGLPYIPASSLKGAIIAALQAQHFRSRQISPTEDELSRLKFPEISISDSTPAQLSDLIVRPKVDYILTGNRVVVAHEKMPLYREYLRPQASVNFTLTINPYAIRQTPETPRQHAVITDIAQVMHALDAKKASMFDEKTGIYGQYTKAYYPAGLTDHSVVVLGGGAGFHSKSAIGNLGQGRDISMVETRKILQSKFRKHNHDQDNPICPRGIKVCKIEDVPLMVGICALSIEE